jgi:uncharacterized protein with PIN domain
MGRRKVGEMGRTRSEEQRRVEFGRVGQEVHQRLYEWRKVHPEATFDEIAEQVSEERKQLMGGLLGELATEGGPDLIEGNCPECGGSLQNKGKKKRQVLHREGEVRLERNYYYCPACKQGFFPPGP